MEALKIGLGLLLGLAGLALTVVGLVAVVKPLPKLKLGKRHLGLIAILVGLGSCVGGGALMPPLTSEQKAEIARQDSEREKERAAAKQKRAEASNSGPQPAQSSAGPAATKQAPPPPAPLVPAFDLNTNQVVQGLNDLWRRGELVGAFDVRTPQAITVGPNAGGSSVQICVNAANCAVVERRVDGKVVSMMTIATPDGSPKSAAESIILSLGGIQVLNGQSKAAVDEFQRQLSRVADGQKNSARRVGDVCILVAGGSGLGVWTTTTRAPC